MTLEAIGIREKDKPFRVMYSKEFSVQLNSLLPGKYKLTVKKYRKDKSLPQLGYLFGCVYPLSQKLLIDAGWELATIDEVDIWWKSMFAKKDIINRHTGEIETIPDLKRNFTTTDMMGYIEAIRNYCSEFLGGYIPSPEEQTNFEFNKDTNGL